MLGSLNKVSIKDSLSILIRILKSQTKQEGGMPERWKSERWEWRIVAGTGHLYCLSCMVNGLFPFKN